MKEPRACLLITSLSFVVCTYLVYRVGRISVLLMGVHTDITTGDGKKLKSVSVEESVRQHPMVEPEGNASHLTALGER